MICLACVRLIEDGQPYAPVRFPGPPELIWHFHAHCAAAVGRGLTAQGDALLRAAAEQGARRQRRRTGLPPLRIERDEIA